MFSVYKKKNILDASATSRISVFLEGTAINGGQQLPLKL